MERIHNLQVVLESLPDITHLLESEHRILAYSKQESLVYHMWLPSNYELDDETFKSEVLAVIKELEKIRPAKFLADDKYRNITITSDLNEFLIVNFFPIYGHPAVKKVAMIRSDLLSMQGELENAMDELNASIPESERSFRFFDDASLALNWLSI